MHLAKDERRAECPHGAGLWRLGRPQLQGAWLASEREAVMQGNVQAEVHGNVQTFEYS